MFAQIALKNTQKARNGNSRYLLARIEDMTGSAKCVMWPDDFARFKEEVRDDQPYIIKGTVDRRREEPTLVINRILTLEQAQRELAAGCTCCCGWGAISRRTSIASEPCCGRRRGRARCS